MQVKEMNQSLQTLVKSNTINKITSHLYNLYYKSKKNQISNQIESNKPKMAYRRDLDWIDYHR